jgi:SAM-dependent methyltransferase
MATVMKQMVEQFLALGRAKGLWRHGAGFMHYCNHQLFPGIDLEGKTVLEIGAGNGKFGLWCAVNGARQVVALEPVGDGADASSTREILYSMRDKLGCLNVRVEEKRIQDYQPEISFDLVLLHYSINHLDENACINLRSDPGCTRVYEDLFRGIRGMMNPGGILIISDCTRTCFWNALGLKNPFAPYIEWFKHQSPNTWASLLLRVGFHSPRISWAYEPKTFHLGRFLLSNRVIAYFYTSIFFLRMEK